jgi:hypothetical protein
LRISLSSTGEVFVVYAAYPVTITRCVRAVKTFVALRHPGHDIRGWPRGYTI